MLHIIKRIISKLIPVHILNEKYAFSSTSVSSALMMADYMGFQEVYLLGCDYNYFRDLEGKNNQHFYADDKALEGRERPKGDNINSLESFLLNSAQLWKQYRLIRKHFENAGKKIFNVSPDSSLDMFPKADFQTVIRSISHRN